MKMDSSIFTKMLKYIKQNVEQENAYLLDIMGTALYKDRAFCESVLYLAGVDEVDQPQITLENDVIVLKQRDEWEVIIRTQLSDVVEAESRLFNSNCSVRALLEIGQGVDQYQREAGDILFMGLSFKELALMIDETCSDMTIELHQFLVENYLVNQLEPG